MKQSIFALFIVLSLSASAATNDVIDLGRRPATFSDLRGHTYRGVLLVRGDLDGVVYAEAQSTGGGRVSYTNLAPATLEALLIPTNRIALAAARAVSKTRTDREYLAAQARAAAEQKAKAEVFERDRPKREAAAKQAAQQEK